MKIDMNIHTDFADELLQDEFDNKAITLEKEETESIVCNYISVHHENNILKKQVGDYVTIEFKDISHKDIQEKIIEMTCKQLHKMLDRMQLNFEKVLVVGLGNRFVTSDALGPEVVNDVFVTAHYYRYENKKMLKGTKNVAAIQPGVMGQTGLETLDIVLGIVQSYQPDFVLVVDALATSDLNRINRAIQINNTGIAPGSGVGNHRITIDKKTLKVPVLAIGIATVISVHSLICNAFPQSKMEEVKKEILQYMVTPKAMDHELEILTHILSEVINQTLHPDYLSL